MVLRNFCFNHNQSLKSADAQNIEILNNVIKNKEVLDNIKKTRIIDIVI
jgi:hypothetical protein